jgi:hypothetical protein
MGSVSYWYSVGVLQLHSAGVEVRVVITNQQTGPPLHGRISRLHIREASSVRYLMALGQDWRYLLPHTYAWLAHTFSFVIPHPALVTSDGNLVDMTMSSSSLTPKRLFVPQDMTECLVSLPTFPMILPYWSNNNKAVPNGAVVSKHCSGIENNSRGSVNGCIIPLTQKAACDTVWTPEP